MIKSGRRIRQRQDLEDVKDFERGMNDHTAEEHYQQILLGSVRSGENPNEPQVEEAAEGYIPPTWNPKNGQEVSRKEKVRLAAIHTERMEMLKGLRRSKEHQKLSPFNQLIGETETWVSRETHRAAVEKSKVGRRGMMLEDNEASQTNEALELEHLIDTPSYIKGKLRPYQVEGVNWLLGLYYKDIHGILADEMGLGKTFQTIALLAYLKYTHGLPGPHLIVCPKSVLGNWFREFKRWCPTMSIYKFHGPGTIRKDLVKMHLTHPIRYDAILTTYEMVNMELNAFKRISWEYLVVDEAHKLKNSESAVHRSLDHLKTHHRLLVTGTPLQNDLKELWALLHFLAPVLFHQSESFETWFDAKTGDQESDAVERMHVILRPMMLRRMKADVATGIPPKKEIYVGCGLTKMQRDWYMSVLARDAESINRATGGSTERLSNIIMHLRKVANHPFLFAGAEEGPPFKTDDKIIINSGKMIILDKLLDRWKKDTKGKHKVLLFSQMTGMLDIIEDYCIYRGYKYCRIDGSTGGLDRDSQMAQFNNPSSPQFIFLLSTRAGGLGINLQAANHCILFDSDWNPQVDLQAQDRCHRIGQQRMVRVYRFITSKTIEESIYKRALKKLYLDAMVVQQGRVAQKNTQASKEELLSMIRFGANEIFQSRGEEFTDTDLDSLLAVGEEKMDEMHKETAKTQQASLASFKLGVAESNMYDFEGLNYRSGMASKMLHVNLKEQTTEGELKEKCSKYGEVIKVSIHPNLKEAIVSFRTQGGASATLRGLDLKCQYASKDSETIITRDMVSEGLEKGEGEQLGRGKRAHNLDFLSDEQLEKIQITTTKEFAPPRLPAKPSFPIYQLYNLPRILEIYNIEVALRVKKWRKEKSKWEAQYQAVTTEEAKAENEDDGENYDLTDEELAEKERLHNEGFPNWTYVEFTRFKEALTFIDKNDFPRLAIAVGTKTEGEVRDYSQAFWTRGESILKEKFTSIEDKMKKVRAKVAREREVVEAAKWKVEQYANPEEQFRLVKPLPHPDAIIDRKMFFSAYDHQLNVDLVPNEIRQLPELQFDVFYQTRPDSFFKGRVQSMLSKIVWEKRVKEGFVPEKPLGRKRKRKEMEDATGQSPTAAEAGESPARSVSPKRDTAEATEE